MSFFSAEPITIPALHAARRRRFIRLLWALAFLAILGGLSKPVYRMARRWRGRALIAQAEAALKAQRWEEAAAKTQAAHLLMAEAPGTLRLFAQLNSRAGQPRAIDYWRQLLASSEATAADRSEAAKCALQFNQLDLASPQIAWLLEHQPQSLEPLELSVQLALQKGDRPKALDFTRRILLREPAHPFARLTQARLLFSSPQAAQQDEGRQLLRVLAREKDSGEALGALESLAADTTLPAAEIAGVAQALRTHVKATPAVRLAGMTLQIRLDASRRAALIEEAVTQFGHGSADDLLALVRWCNQLNEHSRVLELVSQKAALGQHELFLAWLDALAALKRWQDVLDVLQEEKAPIEPVFRELFQARSARELDEPGEAVIHWNRALEAAQTPASLLFIAQYAEKIGASDMAEKAYRRLLRHPAWTRRAYLALVPILENQGDTRALRDIMKELVRLGPPEVAPRNDLAYLDLLLAQNLPASRQIAEQLVREKPALLAHHTTLALALLRAGNPAEALRVYERLEIQWAQSPPGFMAVYAAVLAANGQTEKARSMAASIPVAKLKPEEKLLVDSLL